MPNGEKLQRGASAKPEGPNILAIPGRAVASVPPPQDVLCEGWALKKRRRKMQGFARRYFTLYSDGVLSYAVTPNATPRDQIALRFASISSSEKRRDIHIDSGTSTFHIKCLSSDDFDMWMKQFRKVIQISKADELVARSLSRANTRFSMSSVSIAQPSHSRLGNIAQEIGRTLKDVESALVEIREEEARKAALNSKPKKHKEKDHHKEKDYHLNGKEHGKEKDGFFGIFHRKISNPSITSSVSPVTSPDIAHLDYKDPHSPAISPTNSPISTPQAIPSAQESILDRLYSYLTALQTQHSALMALFESTTASAQRTASPSPLPPMPEELTPTDPISRGIDAIMIASRMASPDMRRQSVATLASGAESSNVWFDAVDGGAEEFVLDAAPESLEALQDEEAEVEDQLSDGDHQTGSIAADTASIAPTVTESHFTSKQNSVMLPPPPPIVRRAKLPAPTSGDEISLFSVLKKNVGKDLSTVALPVSFNEPISLLQRLAEDVEYTDLLNQAVACTDPVERMCLVAAFAVSGYACTLYRASRKPFNPLLGETFEDIRMNLIAEKVSHQPPIMALHAEGKGWRYWATSTAKNKFWGKSLEIIPIGTSHLVIGGEEYQWQKPSSFMRNLIAGERYLEHCGPMSIKSSSGLKCDLDFKESGFWGTYKNQVTGNVSSKDTGNEVLAQLKGTWHETMTRLLDPAGSHLQVLWRANPFPSHALQYYGFTSFTTSLNEITLDIEPYLPPTDSRWRPDQRAFENGEVQKADMLKVRVEEAQRQRRRDREARKVKWSPRWFEQVDNGSHEPSWVYKGGYWEARAKEWDAMEALW